MSSPQAANTSAAPTDSYETVHAGMRTVDITGNDRIAIVMETVGALSRARDPEAVVDLFSKAMIRLGGRRGLVAITSRGLKSGQYRITRLIHDDGSAVIDSKTAWSDGSETPVREGGFFGQLIRTAYPELIHHFHLRNDPVLGDELERYGSLMAIPVFDEGEPMLWAIFLHPDDEGFDPDDMENAILRSNLIGRSARHVQISRELQRANDRIQDQVHQIASIQRALLPTSLPNIPGVRLAARYDVYEHAGGDMYDFVPVGRCRTTGEMEKDGAWLFVIADASGHGPAAAVVMAMLHAILHAYPKEPCGPAEVLEHANKHLSAKRIESSFVTAFMALYVPATRELVYARAGHNPPLLKPVGSGKASHRLDDVGGIPLGVLPDATYEDHRITLEPGHTLVMYTDGITEAMDEHREMFGVEGIERALVECSGEADCVIGSISDALAAHEHNGNGGDDKTIVAVQIE